VVSRGWVVKTIDDLKASTPGSIAIGPFGSRMKRDNYVQYGTPVIRGTNLGKTKSFVGDFVYVSPEFAAGLGNCNVYEGDLVFPHRGSIGEVGIVTGGTNAHYVLSTSMMKVTVDHNRVNPLYLFYFFRSRYGRYELLKNASQVGTPGIATPLTSLRSIRVPVPPLPEQHAIAHILGSLDDKIELNHQMNATLEAIARAIFKSWFVDFDPVRANRGELDSLPPDVLALFPDTFAESELGAIPAGWEVETLGKVAKNLRRNVDPDDLPPHTPYIGLGHMPQESISLTEWGEAQEVGSTKRQFKEGEILFGKLRPYFHKVGIAPVDGICSTDIVVIMPKQPNWYAFTLCHFSSAEFIDYTTAVSTGTKMPRTKWRDMSRYEIVVPPKEVAVTFGQLVEPMFHKIRSNILESRTLADLRDTLLPKLISGELRVPDTMIENEE